MILPRLRRISSFFVGQFASPLFHSFLNLLRRLEGYRFYWLRIDSVVFRSTSFPPTVHFFDPPLTLFIHIFILFLNFFSPLAASLAAGIRRSAYAACLRAHSPFLPGADACWSIFLSAVKWRSVSLKNKNNHNSTFFSIFVISRTKLFCLRCFSALSLSFGSFPSCSI